MTSEEAEKAREFWREFSEKEWPKDIAIIGDYRHAWGTEWSGFLLLETDTPQIFFEFWPKFRDKTRWYIENTRTVIGLKRKPADWL